jgi:hypothetical protein
MVQKEEPVQEDILSDLFEGQDQHRKKWDYERRRTRNRLLWVPLLLYAGSTVRLLLNNAASWTNILGSMAVPILFITVAFLALTRPRMAVTVSAGMFLALQVYYIYFSGLYILGIGMLYKIMVLFFYISAWQSALDAEKAKRQLTA